MAARSLTFRLKCLSCFVPANAYLFHASLTRIPDGISACSCLCDTKFYPECPEATPMEPINKKILLIDNDENVLIALERVLEEHGYDTTTAWDLPSAADLIATNEFDLLLVGDHPPDLNCERLLKNMPKQGVQVPCVVMHSAARHPFSEAYLRHLGASGVACKWNESEVLDEVEQAIATTKRVSRDYVFEVSRQAS